MEFVQTTTPLGSLTISAIVACLPLATMFLTLGVLKWKAHWAGLASLIVAIGVGIAAFKMPVTLALLAGTEGVAFGLYPIAWIVICAVFLYSITVESGRFNDLRATFNIISPDLRIQAVLIAFCFGGLLEALAGYGAPIAITGAMLMTLGFSPVRAAMVVLLANTAPVAYGAVAIPIDVAAKVSGLDAIHVSAVVGHQTPVLALFVPTLLVLLVDGFKGVKQVLPVSLTIGIVFAIAQWMVSQTSLYTLTDVFASLGGLAAAVILLQFWQPQDADRVSAALSKELKELRDSGLATEVQDDVVVSRAELTNNRIWMAVMPYVLVVIIFGLAKLVGPVKSFLASTTVAFDWPGLAGKIGTIAGDPYSVTYKFDFLSNPGTHLLITSVLVAIFYGVGFTGTFKIFGETLWKMRFSVTTMGFVLGLAYVMNASGQTQSIGYWVAGIGAAFAFLSPVLGWLGVFVTGSDTSSNALFGALQHTAAGQIGVDPYLLVASNSSGGVVGKMISPQNLSIATTAVGLAGQESLLLRKVVLWSFGMLLVLCLLIGFQSTDVLSWMLPVMAK